jgi:hypothetical protein
MIPEQQKPDAFDRWLTEALRDSPDTPRARASFADRVVHQLRQTQANQALEKVRKQQRIAFLALRIAVAATICLLCCPPVWRAIYAAAGAVLTQLIVTVMEPTGFRLAVIAVFILGLGLLLREAWNTIAEQ